MTDTTIGLLRKRNIRIVCFALSLAGFILDTVIFYPGLLSPDSLDQYTQALTHQFTDWHPPMMAALWSLLLHLYNGPQPMLFLQLLLLWGSCYILLLVFVEYYSIQAVLVLIFMGAPFVQNFAGNIWKDVHLALAWLLASVILIRVFYEQRKMTIPEAVFSLLLMSYGCWVRSNALPGVIPLAAFWISLNSRSEKNHLSLRPLFLLKALGLSALIMTVQIAVTKIVLKPQKNYIEYKLFVHDLAGIYYSTGEMMYPDFIKNHEGFDTAYLLKHYKYSTFDNIWWNDDNKHLLPPIDGDKIVELRHYWLKALAAHPIVYLKNKTHGFLDFMRITNSGSRLEILYPYTHPNNFGFTYTPNRLGLWFFRKIEARQTVFYLKPWFWLLVNLLLLPVVFSKKLMAVKAPVLILSLSSLFYLGFEFFVFPADTEFRYFYWNCLALSLAGILIIAEFFKQEALKRLQ